MIGKIIAIIIFACWICGVICALTHGAFMGKVFHKLLGWHWPDLDEPPTMEGIIITSHCRFCGKEITLDSQGNWYTYE